MRPLLPVLALLSASCSFSPTGQPLKQGRWAGTLTPMNHPGMENPVSYEVRYSWKDLLIKLIGPDGVPIATHSPRLEADTLYFSFKEPEEQVLLNCVLAGHGTTGGSCDRHLSETLG